jgi:hypothetical protein
MAGPVQRSGRLTRPAAIARSGLVSIDFADAEGDEKSPFLLKTLLLFEEPPDPAG